MQASPEPAAKAAFSSEQSCTTEAHLGVMWSEPSQFLPLGWSIVPYLIKPVLALEKFSSVDVVPISGSSGVVAPTVLREAGRPLTGGLSVGEETQTETLVNDPSGSGAG